MKSIENIPIEDNVVENYDRRKDIYNYGDNNDYPKNIKLVIDYSVTASACTDLLSSFIYGKGFESNEFYLNAGGVTPNSFLRKISNYISDYKGFAVHVGYNALGQKSSFKIIPFNWVRWGKEDVNGYKSKLKVSKDWNDRKIKPTTYDVYKPESVLKQIELSGGIENYNGQIFYGNLDFNEIYPKSFANSVIDDCISENKSSLLKKNLLTKGFVDSTFVITKPFENDKDRENFRTVLKKNEGADGAGSINHIEGQLETTELDKEIYITKVDSNINDKLFEYTDKNASQKISKAYGVPSALIDANDNSIFGQSGETLKQMRLYYQEKTDYIRTYVEETIEELFNGTINDKLNNTDFTIIKLVKEDAVTNN